MSKLWLLALFAAMVVIGSLAQEANNVDGELAEREVAGEMDKGENEEEEERSMLGVLLGDAEDELEESKRLLGGCRTKFQTCGGVRGTCCRGLRCNRSRGCVRRRYCREINTVCGEKLKCCSGTKCDHSKVNSPGYGKCVAKPKPRIQCKGKSDRCGGENKCCKGLECNPLHRANYHTCVDQGCHLWGHICGGKHGKCCRGWCQRAVSFALYGLCRE